MTASSLDQLAAEGDALLEAYVDEESSTGYVLRELELLIPSVRNGQAAAARGAAIPAWLYLRVVCESAVRLAWVAQGSDDADAIRERLARVATSDLGQMLDADSVVRSVMGGKGFVSGRRELNDLRKSFKPAPSLQTMASETGLQGAYAVARLASAAIHPGLTAGTSNFLEVSLSGFREGFAPALAVALVSAAGILAALAPDTNAPSLPLSGAEVMDAYVRGSSSS
jgi:hypothetical protein